MTTSNDCLPNATTLVALAGDAARQSDRRRFISLVAPAGALVLSKSSAQAAPVPLSKTVHRGDGLDDDPVTAITAPTSFLIQPLTKSDRNSFPNLTVGRARNNDIVIIDDTVSKFHASLRIDGDSVRIQDEGSRNGTSVNGSTAPARGAGEPLAVPSHATMRFGTVALVYLAPADLLTLLDARAASAT